MVNPFIEEVRLTIFVFIFIGGRLYRVNEILLYYRYHPEATTFSVHE
jgi:hypothetical protein